MVLIDRAADGRSQRKEPDWSFFTLDTAPKNLKLRNTLDFDLKNWFGHLKTLKTRLFYFINSSLSLVFNLKAYKFNVNLKIMHRLPQSVALPASQRHSYSRIKGRKMDFGMKFFSTPLGGSQPEALFLAGCCVWACCVTHISDATHWSVSHVTVGSWLIAVGLRAAPPVYELRPIITYL